MTSEVPQDPIDVEAGTDTAARASITVGRKRDASRDAAILDAAISILAEVGYDGMTMDMVAVRAKAGKATVYRRWATKADMVLEAVARMKREQVDLDNLPDTGNLRDDLLALFRPQPMEETERKLRAMAGMAALLTQHPALADTAHGRPRRPLGGGEPRLDAAGPGPRRDPAGRGRRDGRAGHAVHGRLPGAGSGVGRSTGPSWSR